jgi:outer membrane protein TolC
MHGAVTDGAGESWKSPNALPDLDPVASLRMRPDVGVAEEEVMGAVAHTQISRADLYPRISLVGALGLTNDPSGLSRDNSLRFSAGPQLTWGLFNLDRTRAQINEADAKAEAAYHGWHQTTLSALEEAENAIDKWVSAAQTERSARNALKASQQLSTYARQRYQRGLISKVELYQADMAHLDAQRSLSQAHVQTALNWSRACLALGGGWRVEGGKHNGAP